MSNLKGKKRRVDDEESDDSEELDSTTVDLEEADNCAIKEYFEWECPAMEFPKIVRPVALDGASGVGKTQQAFALLKNGDPLVYVVMTEDQENDQPIYAQMRNLQQSIDPEFNVRVDNTIAALIQYGQEIDDQDPLSEYFIGKAFNSPNQNLRNLSNQLLLFLYRLCLKYNDGKLWTPYRNQNLPRGTHPLKGIILFLDEALPRERDEKSTNKLRFMRNLGCALKMQVVAAGTASTIANMNGWGQRGSLTSRNDFSRTSLWIRCLLHWQGMKAEDLDRVIRRTAVEKLVSTNATLKELLLNVRPLLVHSFVGEKNVGEDDLTDVSGLASRLRKVGYAIMKTKESENDIDFAKVKLSWLMGIWLQQEKLSACPFAIKPPQLVCNHFFEPALLTYANGEPWLQKGIVRTRSVAGPMTVSLHKIAATDMKGNSGFPRNTTDGAWAVSYDGSEHYSLTKNFEDITRALSSCVQQCLAREPLLAIALSYAHKYTTAEEFQKDLSRCLQESAAEHTLGAMSGEQMEGVAYAAIQQASFYREGVSLVDFCQALRDFLEPKVDRGEIIKAVRTKWGIPAKVAKSQKERPEDKAVAPGDHEESEDEADDMGEAPSDAPHVKAKSLAEKTLRDAMRRAAKKESKVAAPAAAANGPAPPAAAANRPAPAAEGVEPPIRDVPQTFPIDPSRAKEETLPRMVPACSSATPDWVKRADASNLQILRDLQVAGLVPGKTNARCDIDAFKWPFTVDASPCWSFEVKARSSTYSRQDGIRDLVAKCEDDTDTGGKYHAMLIAVRGQFKTETIMWEIEKESIRYFRVLVLVAGNT